MENGQKIIDAARRRWDVGRSLPGRRAAARPPSAEARHTALLPELINSSPSHGTWRRLAQRESGGGRAVQPEIFLEPQETTTMPRDGERGGNVETSLSGDEGNEPVHRLSPRELADSAARKRAVVLFDSDSDDNSRLQRKISPRERDAKGNAPKRMVHARPRAERDASSDEDFNQIIGKELRRRTAHAASIPIASVERNGHAKAVRRDRDKDEKRSESGEEALDWASHTPRAHAANKATVSASLHNLLNKMQTREPDPSGFNDIIKDAIHDKLRKSKGTPARSTPRTEIPSARKGRFSIETYVPQSPPDLSPPNERENKSKGSANRLLGKSSGRSELDFDDIAFMESMRRHSSQRSRLDGCATWRLIQYFEAKQVQMFFRAAWSEWVALCSSEKRKRERVGGLAIRRMLRSSSYKAFAHWKELYMNLKTVVKDGHYISLRVDIRVMRSCFCAWREMEQTEPVEKILFMEPICHVTKMLRISRHVNEEYERHLCFASWKGHLKDIRMKAHLGRCVITRRLRSLAHHAFLSIRELADRKRNLLALGSKICHRNLRLFQKTVISELWEVCLRKKTLSVLGLKVATYCLRASVKRVLSGWSSIVFSGTTYAHGRVGSILAEQTAMARKRKHYRGWIELRRNERRLQHQHHQLERRLRKIMCSPCFSAWLSCWRRARTLAVAERRLRWLFALGGERASFGRWANWYLHRKHLSRVLAIVQNLYPQSCLSECLRTWRLASKRQSKNARAFTQIRQSNSRNFLETYMLAWRQYSLRTALLSRRSKSAFLLHARGITKTVVDAWMNLLHEQHHLSLSFKRVEHKAAARGLRVWYHTWAGQAMHVRRLKRTGHAAEHQYSLRSGERFFYAWRMFAWTRARMILVGRRLFGSLMLKNKRCVLNVWYDLAITARRGLQKLRTRLARRHCRNIFALWLNIKTSSARHKMWAQRKVAMLALRFCNDHLQAHFLAWCVGARSRNILRVTAKRIETRSMSKRFRLLFAGWDTQVALQHWKSLHQYLVAIKIFQKSTAKRSALAILSGWADAAKVSILRKRSLMRLAAGHALRDREVLLHTCCGVWRGLSIVNKRVRSIDDRIRDKILRERVIAPFAGWFNLLHDRKSRMAREGDTQRGCRSAPVAALEQSRRSLPGWCACWGMRGIGSVLLRRIDESKRRSISVWRQTTRIRQQASMEFARLCAHRDRNVVRVHFKAIVELLWQLTTLRDVIVLGYYRASSKWKLQSYFTAWSLGVRAKTDHRRMSGWHQRRWSAAMLQRGWEGWLTAILWTSQGLLSARQDVERQDGSDEYGTSQKENVYRLALLQRRRLDKSLCMLLQAKERLRLLRPAFHHWGRNIGIWIPRRTLFEALACKALLAISPVPPHLHATGGARGNKEAGLEYHPAALYAKVQIFKDTMDRWQWVLRWRRTKDAIRRQQRDGALDVCWKVWCLTVSQSHLFRHAVLKITSWTSVRCKGMCFRAWAVKCRYAVSTRERSLWNREDISWSPLLPPLPSHPAPPPVLYKSRHLSAVR